MIGKAMPKNATSGEPQVSTTPIKSSTQINEVASKTSEWTPLKNTGTEIKRW